MLQLVNQLGKLKCAFNMYEQNNQLHINIVKVDMFKDVLYVEGTLVMPGEILLRIVEGQ